MFSPARHHFCELQLPAPEREVLVWSGSPRDPREGRDHWSVLAWSPPPVESRENGVRGQRDLPSARGAAELRPPCSAVQDATTDDTAPQLQARVRQRIPIGARPEIHNSSRSRPRTAQAKGGGVALGRDDLGPLGPPWTS